MRYLHKQHTTPEVEHYEKRIPGELSLFTNTQNIVIYNKVRLVIPSGAAAFLVVLLGLHCSATLTAPMLSEERTDEGRRRFLSDNGPSLLNWL